MAAAAACWHCVSPITNYHHPCTDIPKKLHGLVSLVPNQHLITGSGSLLGFCGSRVLVASSSSSFAEVSIYPQKKDVAFPIWRSPNGEFISKDMLFKALSELEAAVERGEKPDKVEATQLMHDLCKIMTTDKAASVLEMMVKSGVHPNPSAYTVLVNNMCKTGNVWNAIQLVERMIEYGYQANSITYNTLIKWLCVLGNFSKCLELFNKFMDKGLYPNVYTYPLLLEAARKEKGVDEAKRLLEELVAKDGQPTVISYDVVLMGLCKEGRMDEAVRFFKDYPSKGLELNVLSYNILLREFCEEGRWNEAYELLAEMHSHGLASSVPTWNILISSLSENGLVHNAIEALELMLQSGFEPNTETYNSIIAQLCREGKVEQLLKYLDEMLDRGCGPDVGTYNAIAELCENGMVQEAFSIIQSFGNNQEHSIQDHYNKVISYLCKKGNTYPAFRLLDEMTDWGFVPNTDTYSWLVRGLSNESLFGAAIEIFQITMETNYANLVDWNPLIGSLCNSWKTDVSLDLFQMMMNKGCKPRETAYRLIVQGIALEGGRELAAEVLSELYERKVVSMQTVEMLKLKYDLEGLPSLRH